MARLQAWHAFVPSGGRFRARAHIHEEPRPWFVMSYRRAGAGSVVSLLADKLKAAFPERLFLDLDNIQPGSDFRSTLGSAIARADALIVVIHPEWADDRDERGQVRLHNDDDVVRYELKTALAAGISILPILVEGARMPRVDQLPADIAALSSRSALELHLDTATDREINAIVLALVRTRPIGRVLSWLGWKAALLGLLATGLVYPYWRWTSDAPLLTLPEFLAVFPVGVLASASMPILVGTLCDYARRRAIDANSPVRGFLSNAAGELRPSRILVLWAVVAIVFPGIRAFQPETIVVDLVRGRFDAANPRWILTHQRDDLLSPADAHVVVTLNLGRWRPPGSYRLSLQVPGTEQFLLNQVWTDGSFGFGAGMKSLEGDAEYPRPGLSDPVDLAALPASGKIAAEVGSSNADSWAMRFRVGLWVQRGGQPLKEVRHVCVNIPLDLPKAEGLPVGGVVPMARLDRASECSAP